MGDVGDNMDPGVDFVVGLATVGAGVGEGVVVELLGSDGLVLGLTWGFGVGEGGDVEVVGSGSGSGSPVTRICPIIPALRWY